MITVSDAMITVARLSDVGATVGDVRSMFDDAHLHAALIVEGDLLVCVVDRTDLTDDLDDDVPATRVGLLAGRAVAAGTPLDAAVRLMSDTGRRRLAVIDDDGNYRGLLCLKSSGTGFCSNADVRSRAGDPTSS